MIYDQTIFLGPCAAPPRVFGPGEIEVFTPLPHAVVVEADPPFGARDSGLVLPDETREVYGHPDTGTVVASGDDTELFPGDRVIVRPYCGKRVVDCQVGAYSPSPGAWTLFLGIDHLEEGGRAFKVRTDQHILAVIQPQTTTLRMMGSKILVRRDPLQEKEGAIYVPDGNKFRSGAATVVAVGPLAGHVKPGDRIVYAPGGVELDFRNPPAWFKEAYPDRPEDFAILCAEETVFTVLEPD